VIDMKQEAMDRREAVKRLLAARDGALVVTGLGSPSYDVHAVGDADHNYYLWGAMGGAALVGLGIAQAQPNKRVMVITGDGEQLMAFGSLATISVTAPRNLDLIVLDNQHFGETGMQSSHTGRGIDIVRVKGVIRTPAGRLLLQTVRKIVQSPEILPELGDTREDNIVVMIGRGFTHAQLTKSLQHFVGSQGV